METRISIFDTTLRDGEQAAGCSMNADEKLRMAHKLEELGVDVIEAGFPIASQGDFDAVAAIAARLRGPIVAGLARAKREDIERAARALAKARRPRIHTFIATSPIHREHKLRMIPEQIIDQAVKAVETARSFVDDVEFSAEDASRTEPSFLCRIAVAAAEAGAGVINIPDTVGYTLPHEFNDLVGQVVDVLAGRAVVSVHCHNDLGLATANSLAGVVAGARQVECTVNGIGERAGNAALEEVVMAVRTRADQMPFVTAVNTKEIFPASQLLATLVGFAPQPNKAVVGRNAFAHESGIHQDGVIKERTTYEIMAPWDVGVPESRLVLGKHSGRAALRQRLAALGFSFGAAEIEEAYHRFIGLADSRKKGVADEEILAIGSAIYGRRAVAAEV